MVKVLLLLGCWITAVLALTSAGDALQAPLGSEHVRRQWRKWGYKKVKKDSERLVALTQDLSKEVLKQEQGPLAPAVQERIRALEKQAKELKAAVAALDENVLSLPVVKRAGEIKDEAHSLRGIFEQGSQGKRRKKLLGLIRAIEKRADSLANHMRSP